MRIDDLALQYALGRLATRITIITLPVAGGVAKLAVTTAGLKARADTVGKSEDEAKAALSRALLDGGTLSLTWDLPWVYVGPKEGSWRPTVIGKLRVRGVADVESGEWARGVVPSMDLLITAPAFGSKSVRWHAGLLATELFVSEAYRARLKRPESSGRLLLAQLGIRITGSVSAGVNLVLAKGGLFADVASVYPHLF